LFFVRKVALITPNRKSIDRCEVLFNKAFNFTVDDGAHPEVALELVDQAKGLSEQPVVAKQAAQLDLLIILSFLILTLELPEAFN